MSFLSELILGCDKNNKLAKSGKLPVGTLTQERIRASNFRSIREIHVILSSILFVDKQALCQLRVCNITSELQLLGSGVCCFLLRFSLIHFTRALLALGIQLSTHFSYASGMVIN